MNRSDPSRCPLCGSANQCARANADAAQPCWCFTAQVDRQALERIPPEERGCRCICPACASGARPATRRND